MGSTSCAKRFVLLLDLLSVLLALALIVFSAYVFFTYETDEVASFAAYAYFGVGVATLAILFFGCFGKLRESVCCTVTFIVLMSVLIFAQIAVVFLLSKGQSSVASDLANIVDDAWAEELQSPGKMSQFENQFSCCGRLGPQDYVANELLPPSSCYRNGDSSQLKELIASGCRSAFEEYWKSVLLVFNVVAWSLIVVEILGSCVSCILCNSIRNDQRRSHF